MFQLCCSLVGALIVSAIVAFFAMYDYPETANFLNKEEKMEVLRRLEEDRSSLDNKFAWRYVLDAFIDWKIWIMALITLGIFGSLYSFALFLPTIIKSLGYTNNVAQLMTVPPYFFACLCCLANGYISDRFKQRGVFIIGFMLMS
jgi:MFS transporter, ACS family, DAL5 transporter family protein